MDQAEKVDVSIVMPCLNEARTIVECVEQARKALAILAERHGLSGEVLIADNGSTDGSQALATEAGARVVDIDERGYGAALNGGFRVAKGRLLVMGDSDCSYDFVEAVPMVEALMDGAELCMGSRFKGEIKPGAMPWKNRYIGNPVLSAILRLLFRTRISDAHCGIRALTADAFGRLNLSSSGMEFASEMVLKSALMKLKTTEVPVTLSPDKRGRPPHLNPWRDGFRHLFYMLMLSPTWLFMLPAAGLFLFGLVILGMLVLVEDGQMVRIGAFGIGDHWAVVASSSLIMAVQMAFFGLAALLQSFREGVRQLTPATRRLLSLSRLIYWLVAGLGLMGVGLIWAAVIAGGWLQSAGELAQMRPMIAAFTLIVIGVQMFFGGFLLSIIAGNKSRHALVQGAGR